MLSRWYVTGLALLLALLAPAAPLLAHGFNLYCALSADGSALVAGQGGTLTVHIYDNFGNGLPEATITVRAAQPGQPDQVFPMPEHPDGFYSGPVRFPAAGSWQLRVAMISMQEPFHGVSSVNVVAAGASPPVLKDAAVILFQDTPSSSLPVWLEAAVGGVLLLVPLAFALFWRRHPPAAPAAGADPDKPAGDKSGG